jgi:putative nucleotidyltransferase with HDIG domain
MYIAKRLGRNQVRTAEEARQMGEDVSLMALLQEGEQREAAQREGVTPERLRETYTVHMINSLLSLLERRDAGLSAHAHAVSTLATAIAQRRGGDPKEVSRIGMAALLHDIGKVAIPDALLQKVGPLSSHEQAFLQEHAALGAEILQGSPFLDDLVPGVRHHHERWDGSGFPDQLCAEAIPLSARIIAVAEAYDFMQRTFLYHVSCSPEEALAELKRCAGTQFDPAIVQSLTEVLRDQQEHPHSLEKALPGVHIALAS